VNKDRCIVASYLEDLLLKDELLRFTIYVQMMCGLLVFCEGDSISFVW